MSAQEKLKQAMDERRRLQDSVRDAEREVESAILEADKEYKDHLPKWLTLDTINATCPDHSLVSCSDDNPKSPNEDRHGMPYCTRCYLLNLLEYPYLLDQGFRFRLEIRKIS